MTVFFQGQGFSDSSQYPFPAVFLAQTHALSVKYSVKMTLLEGVEISGHKPHTEQTLQADGLITRSRTSQIETVLGFSRMRQLQSSDLQLCTLVSGLLLRFSLKQLSLKRPFYIYPTLDSSRHDKKYINNTSPPGAFSISE